MLGSTGCNRRCYGQCDVRAGRSRRLEGYARHADRTRRTGRIGMALGVRYSAWAFGDQAPGPAHAKPPQLVAAAV